MACEDLFHQELRQRGLRLTPQRELVLAALHAAEAPMLAETLYEAIQAGTPGQGGVALDLSTVYRTLNLLAELQLVASVDATDGPRRYELLGLHGPHLHLACQRCGHVEGLAPQEALAFTAHLAARFGFEADVTGLVIPGLCQLCRAQVNQPQPCAAVGSEIA